MDGQSPRRHPTAGRPRLEHRRYDQSEYEPFWAAAEALDLPLSLHTATRRQGKICGVGDKTLHDASSRATKAFYPTKSGLSKLAAVASKVSVVKRQFGDG